MTPEELAALEEQRDVLLQSLRDLEVERAGGDVGDDDYQALKDDYTVRTAAVLRAIEAGKAAMRGTRPRRPGSRPPSSTGRPRTAPSGGPRSGRARSANQPVGRGQRTLAITLGVAFAIAAVAGLSVVLFSGGRGPGQPVTGSGPSTSTAGGTDRVAEALALENAGQAVDALKLYDEILKDEPNNVEALAYRGWLLKRAGLPDKAMESLDRAVALDPTYADAHFFRGMVLYQDRDDPAGAVVEFKAFLADNPPADFVGAVQEVLAKAEAAAEAKASGAPSPTTTVAPEPAAG